MPRNDFYDSAIVTTLIEAKDYARLVEYVSPFAEAGISDAECELGNIYLCGLGVPVNVIEAERWLRKSAEKDNAVAWNNLGTLYSSVDAQKSKRCYGRAVELDLPQLSTLPSETVS